MPAAIAAAELMLLVSSVLPYCCRTLNGSWLNRRLKEVKCAPMIALYSPSSTSPCGSCRWIETVQL
jgi:hypothetical protein